MPQKTFIGYTISRGWKKLTLFTFDAKTHARMDTTEIVPLTVFNKAQRRQTVLERLQGLNIPLPPACFEPK